jgi:hypothetical protein
MGYVFLAYQPLVSVWPRPRKGLIAYAQGTDRDFALQNRCSSMRKGLQRKSRRKRRKALTRNWSGKPGFFWLAEKNAPKFRIINEILNRL